MIIEHETSVQSTLREAVQTSDKAYPWLATSGIGGVTEAALLPGFVTGPENAGLFLLSLGSLAVTTIAIFRKEYLAYRIRRASILANQEESSNFILSS